MTEPDQSVAHLQKELEALRAQVADLKEAAAQRQRAHKVLEANEQRYRAIVEDQTEFVTRHKDGGVLTFVNQALCRYLGMNRDELIGRNFLPFVFDDDRETLVDHLSSLTLQNPAGTIEHRTVLGNGDLRWHLWSNRALFDATGSFLEFQSVGRDITNRKHTEDLLRKSEERFRAIAENLPGAVFSYDVEAGQKRTVLYLGPGFEDLIGQTATDEIKDGNVDRFIELVHSDDLQKMQDAGHFEPGFAEPVDYIFRLKREPTGYKWVRTIARPTKLSDTVLRWHGVMIDVTDQRVAEQALRQSEERVRSLVENIPIGIFRTTPDGRILQANPALVKMLGYPSFQELAERNLEKDGFEPTYPRHEFRERLERDGVISGMETAWKRRDGSVVYVRENATISRASDGQFYYDGTVEDITERKRAEESLKRTTELLEHLLKVSPTAIYRCEPSGCYPATFISENVERQLGYEPHEFTDDPQFWASHIHPDDASGVLSDLSGLLERDEYTHEYRFLHQNGTYRWMRDELRLMRDADGSPVDIVGSWTDITERKQAELELSEARRRLDHLLSSSPAVVYSCGPGPKYPTTLISGNVVPLLGYRPEEFYDNPEFWQKAVHPDDRDRVLAELSRVEHGESVSYEYQFRHADGHYVWLHDKVIPIQDAEGRLVEFIGSWFDVTAHRKAEEALRDSEDRYRNLFNRVPVGLYRTTPDGHILDANLTLVEMLGYPNRDSLLNIGARSLYAEPDERERLLSEIDRDGVARSLEFQLFRHDGTQIWVRENVRVICNPSGEATSYEGSLEDITQRRRAEEALRQSEASYRAIWDGVNDAIYVHDARTGRVTDMNQRGVELLGYTLDQVRKMTVEDWSSREPPYTQDEAIRRIRDAADGRTQVFEWHCRHKSGQLLWAEVNLKCAIIDGEKRVLGVVREITERKTAEQAREQLESQLRHSHKLQAVGQLAAGVAHDFNSLLAVILGNAELMNRKLMARKTNDVREACTASAKQIIEAVERGSSLVHKLLTFGRARTWNPRPLELNTVVAEMRQILDTALGGTITLAVALAPDLRRIKGDAVQIEQVIMNLILNARDAMPKGGELTIETANVDLETPNATVPSEAAPGPYVRLTVKDTGTGINHKFLDRIFEPFFSTKFPDKGTGLGLSIVHGIVKQAGGHIAVESEPDEGTTFSVYFPAVD